MKGSMALVFALLAFTAMADKSQENATGCGTNGKGPCLGKGKPSPMEIAEGRHDLGIAKGEMLSSMYTDVEKIVKEAKTAAEIVRSKCDAKIEQSEDNEKEYRDKIAGASDGDKVVDPLSGYSKVEKWQEGAETEEAEVIFYKQIMENCLTVVSHVTDALKKAKDLSAEINDESGKFGLFKDPEALEDEKLKLDTLINEAADIMKNANFLATQWNMAVKDYNCGPPPSVNHATLCKDGNTKFSPKCTMTCEQGYDGKGTANALRCRKQGKFGKQIYGEWKGMAVCVGRNCGLPPTIKKAKTTEQEIRYPHMATYNCNEGFSQDGDAEGPKTYTMPCEHTGNWGQNAKHQCVPVRCGNAPVVKNAPTVGGKFVYTEVAEYKCNTGYTVDRTAGGLKEFSVSCQATGVFSQAQSCLHVRCGPPLLYQDTEILSPLSDKYFEDEIKYKCHDGYSLDPYDITTKTFTLECAETGEFVVAPNGAVTVPIPKCQPVSAGVIPKMPHGQYQLRQMFYGDTELVTADLGYSTGGKPTTGLSFTVSVTTDAKFSGVQKLVPVVCGAAPTVQKATTAFRQDAVFENLLNYECENGYSTDKTPAKAKASFTLTCESDGDFSAVPDEGYCANIDDCADHTCGPHGDCVDKLLNYTCDCQSGYENTNVDGEQICGNIDDCGPEACGVGDCKDLLNDYKCLCPSGYHEESDPDGHYCKPNLCGVPADVDNAATTPESDADEKAYYPKVINYQCNTGYTLDAKAGGKNHFQIECAKTAEKTVSKFTETEKCPPVKCGDTPTVNHSQPSRDSAHFGQVTKYTSVTGFTLDGTADGDNHFSTTCQANGEYGELSTFQRVVCGEPDEVANANRAAGSRVYEDTVKYTCFEGFTLDATPDGETEFEIDCKADGKFTKTKNCIAKICGEPEKDVNAYHATTADEGKVSYPRITEVTCNDGFPVGGDKGGNTSFLVKCEKSGKFAKYDPRTCEPVRCGDVPEMKNATAQKVVSLYKGKGEVKGDMLTTIEAVSSTTRGPYLSHNGQHSVDLWNQAGPNQKWKIMPQPGNQYTIEAVADTTRGPYLSHNGQKSVDLWKEAGPNQKWRIVPQTGDEYTIEAVADTTRGPYLSHNGQHAVDLWKEAGPNQKWKLPGFTTSKAGMLHYGERAEYKCLDGFTTGGEPGSSMWFNVECLTSGDFSAPADDMQCRNVNDCEENICGNGVCIDEIGVAPAYTCNCHHGYDLRVKADGRKFCGNTDDCVGIDCGVGDCKDKIGDYTCICPSGYYIGIVDDKKTCVPVRCADETPIVVNGKQTTDPLHSGPVDFPTTMTYKCDEGYSTDASTAPAKQSFPVQCKSNKDLAGVLECQRVTCGTARVLPFTSITQPAATKAILYEGKADYECHEGYTTTALAGGKAKFSVECKSDGKLTDPLVCEPVRCGTAPGVAKSKPALSGDVSFGMKLEYQCDTGYSLNNKVNGKTVFERKCKPDGKFSDLSSEQPCQPVSAGKAPEVKNALMTEYAGEAVASLLQGAQMQTRPEVFYPNGLEYKCNEGYSENGSPDGPTKITAKVNSQATFTPALPAECVLITYSVKGQVKNAKNGAVQSNVKVIVKGQSSKTKSKDGFFTLEGVAPGNVTLVFSKSGFITTEREIVVTGHMAAGGPSDINLSPVLQNDQWRAVLKWGAKPLDLDAYVKWGWSKVCSSQKRRASNNIIGTLEKDVTKGFGPETMMLRGMGKCAGSGNRCDVRYEVQDVNGNDLKTSKAMVTLYTGSRVAATLKIADCIKADPNTVREEGKWWHVATIDGKNNKLKWQCDSGTPAPMNSAEKQKYEAARKKHLEAKEKYTKAKEDAVKARDTIMKAIVASNKKQDALKEKIAKASADDKKVDPLTGMSTLQRWKEDLKTEQAEAKLYKELKVNAKKVIDAAQKGLDECADLKKDVEASDDIMSFETRLKDLGEDSDLITNHTATVEKQLEDASKDYDCGAPPSVNHAESVCTNGNTGTSVKCAIKCEAGYDGKGTANSYRCRKQGKFGQQIYGEWLGAATCVGVVCGKPKNIEKAKKGSAKIRYPHKASYTCYEGFSVDETATGDKSFEVACGTDGKFERDSTVHQCQAITCNSAPTVKHSEPVTGTFYYTDVAKYKCKKGFTIDATPGGLKKFTTSCQATGVFSQAQSCNHVRCGAVPEYQNTDLVSVDSEKYFGDEAKYKCQAGYSYDQKADGVKDLTLVCAANGEFAVKDDEDSAIPKCRAVSAGKIPAVQNGNVHKREMFYGDTATVNAETGYSTGGSATEGLSFDVSVKTDGTFDGMQTFVPVDCGAPPSVSHAKTSSEKVTFGDAAYYSCDAGYSTDESASSSAASFTLSCEADGGYSRVPNLGKCVNIDDCAEHTCGARGRCVDKLQDYECSCDSGFEQTTDVETGEKFCGNINDCGVEACGVGDCIDGVNSWKCNCPSGYESTEEDDGPTCSAKLCGVPPKADNAATEPVEAAKAKAYYQTKIAYQCDTGYTLDAKAGGPNHFEIDCKANTKFSATKKCKKIKCTNAPTVKNGKKAKSNALYLESLKYTCNDGYTVDGTTDGDSHFSVTCQVSGEFSAVSECKPVSCGEPDDIANAARPSGSLVFKDKITYKCAEGFTLNGHRDGKSEFDVKCQKDGKFTKLKSCSPKICGVPSKKINAYHATTADEGKVAYPSITEITCNDGYTVGGDKNGNTSFMVKCTSDGVFEQYDKRECEPVKCGAAPEMQNAEKKKILSLFAGVDAGAADVTFGEKVVYQCKPGYTAGGEPGASKKIHVECSSTGDFSMPADDMQCRNVEDCEVYTCGANGTCIDEIGEAPAYTCDCHHGYDMREKRNGQKFCGNTDDCKGEDCGVGVCKDMIGGYTCTCPSGYYVGQLAATPDKKTCVPLRCEDKPPSLDDGELTSDHSGAVDFPTTLEYKCAEGYSVDGSVSDTKKEFIAQCKSDGQLFGMMACQKISCGTPYVLPFTKLTSPESSRKSIEFEDEAEYECFEGYTEKGKPAGETTFSVKCEANGRLTAAKTCEPVQCEETPTVPNARAGISGAVSYGMTVEFQCDSGYTRDGEARGKNHFKLQCGKDGKLSDLPDSKPCKPVSAGDSPTVANADMTEYNGKAVTSFPVEVTYPNGLEYKCKEGFTDNGSPSGATKITTKVNTQGKLVPSLPAECLAVTYYVKGQVKSARSGKMLSGVKVEVESSDSSLTLAQSTRNSAVTKDGFFTLEGLLPGMHNLVYSKSGYVDEKHEVLVVEDVNAGGEGDVVMTPRLEAGEWRAVLEWGAKPLDLDAYAKWGSGKVYSANPKRTATELTAKLVTDATTGFGPEVMFMKGLGDCKTIYKNGKRCDIRFEVKSQSKDLLSSEATVTLYSKFGKEASYKVSDCQKTVSDNKKWHVFTLDGQDNKLKWGCTSDKEAPEPWAPPTTTTTTTTIDPKSLQDLGKTPSKTLAKCQGDCDADSDCGSGLKCFRRSSSKALVPGCNAGGKGDVPTHDYCYESELPLVLQNLGNSGCTKSDKCGECQGDCDSDDDCINNDNTQLFCFKRDSSDELVPGCTAGGKGDKGTTDYCYARTAASLHDEGNNPKEKLAACHGDCDKDSDCKSGLKCFSRSSSKALVPDCDPGQSGDKPTHDFCYKPSGELELQYLGKSGCKGSEKCGECQGDCDNDGDCSNGLKCFQREKGENVPGCAGTAHKDNTDYCYRAPEAYPLSTKHDGKCLDYNAGNKNVYMHNCHDGKNQQWYIDSHDNLKTNHDDKCLDYNAGNGNVYMHKCHSGKNQKWYFKDGHLKTRHDDKCLDYNPGNKNVYMHKCHDGKNQEWYFKKANLLQSNSSVVTPSLQSKPKLVETNVHVAQQELSAEAQYHSAQQVSDRHVAVNVESTQQTWWSKLRSWFSPAATTTA